MVKRLNTCKCQTAARVKRRLFFFHCFPLNARPVAVHPPHASEHHLMIITDGALECNCCDILMRVTYDCSDKLFKLHCLVYFVCFCKDVYSVGLRSTPHVCSIHSSIKLDWRLQPANVFFTSHTFGLTTILAYPVKTVTILLQSWNIHPVYPRLWKLSLGN